MNNKLRYIRITFEDHIKFDSPGEASYEIINYFATKAANNKYLFVWNANTEFITEKFISQEENFNNNSIDICITGNKKLLLEIKTLIEENITTCKGVILI